MTFRLLFLTALSCAAAEPVPPAAGWTESLSPEAIQEIFHTMKKRGGLDQTALNRAAVAGLVASGESGFQLRPKTAAAGQGIAPPVIQLLPGAGAPLYIRPRGGPDATGLGALDAAIGSQKDATAPLILDLRSCALTEDPAELAALLSRFVPQGAPLFSQDAALFAADFATPWENPLWLLIDDTLSPEAELVAAVLTHHRRPMVIFGSETAGRAAPGRDFPVDGKTVLRVPAGTWKLPDGAPAAGRKLRPSVPVAPNAEARARLFAAENPADTLLPAVRPRRNEAGLVAKEDPEISWRVAGFPEVPPADPVLQAALDLCRARAALEPTPAPK